MSKRVFVFIDASNLWATQKTKGNMFDLAKLKNYLKDKHEATELKIYYYDAYPAPNTRDRSIDGKFRFYVFLEKSLGFIVRKKALKQIRTETDHGIIIKEKGNMDVEMAIDVVNQINNYDEMILFSGDSDFLSLINFARNGGKSTFVYSTDNNVSRELKTGSDGYTDILRISEDIWGNELKQRQ